MQKKKQISTLFIFLFFIIYIFFWVEPSSAQKELGQPGHWPKPVARQS